MPYAKPSTTNPGEDEHGAQRRALDECDRPATRRNNRHSHRETNVKSIGLNIGVGDIQNRLPLEKFLAIGYHGAVTESPTGRRTRSMAEPASGRTAHGEHEEEQGGALPRYPWSSAPRHPREQQDQSPSPPSSRTARSNVLDDLPRDGIVELEPMPAVTTRLSD